MPPPGQARRWAGLRIPRQNPTWTKIPVSIKSRAEAGFRAALGSAPTLRRFPKRTARPRKAMHYGAISQGRVTGLPFEVAVARQVDDAGRHRRSSLAGRRDGAPRSAHAPPDVLATGA